MSELQHITPEQIAEYGVVAAPDRLTGKAQDNKAIFDRLVRELVAIVVNDIIDKTNELLTAEDTREENEADRIAAESLRESAEELRVQAENTRQSNESDRVEAEAQRVAAELLRVQAESLRASAEENRNSAESRREAAEALRESSTAGIVAQATAQANAAATSATTAEIFSGHAEYAAEVSERNAEFAQEYAEFAQTNAQFAQASASDAAASKTSAAQSAQTAIQYSGHAPVIQNGNWCVWDYNSQAYVDTGVVASGASVTAEGMFGFSIDENGDLILSYTGDDPPPFEINDDGDLIYTLNGNTINLGRVVGGGGTGGTSNYNDLTNKPSINGVQLIGNKTSQELGIQDGAPGQAATITISSTETVPAGADAAFVELPESTPQNRLYKAQVPQGPAGAGVPSAEGVPDNYVLTPAGWAQPQGGGSEREWTLLGETDCSVVGGDIIYNGLDNYTEFLILAETVKNESTSNSGYSLYINNRQIAQAAASIRNQSLSTENYQWVYARYNGLVWDVRSTAGATLEANLSMRNANASFPYNFVLNVGAAAAFQLTAPVAQYQAVTGKITVWGR